VIALSPLLLAVARGVATLRLIGIDSCVDVEAEEVRRLASIELQASSEAASGIFDVAVSCKEGGQELSVTNRATERVTVRGIDLSAVGTRDRDARTRELALAIAELVRRANEEEQQARAEPPPPEPVVTPPAAPIPVHSESPPSWRAQLGASAVIDAATGGEALFGADIAGRIHLSPWLIGELRVGGRKTRPIDFESGRIDGTGLFGSVGLSFDATPDARYAGVAFGARLGLAAIRYSVIDDDGERLGVATAPAVSANATVSGFIALSRRFGVLIDAAVGRPLHTVAIRENDRLISALSGVLLSSSVGVAAQF
jgi:hypothetical protein